MEPEKKKKIILSVSILIVFVILITVGIVVGVLTPKKKNNKSPQDQNIEIDTNAYNEDIFDEVRPSAYNGDFAFDSIAAVKFNYIDKNGLEFTKEQKAQYESAIISKPENGGCHSINEFIYFLNKTKKAIKEDEILTFNTFMQNNKETSTYIKTNNDKVIHYGDFVGNKNLALIRLESQNEKTNYLTISLNYSIPTSAKTPDKDLGNPDNDGKTLYVFENVLTQNPNSDRVLYTIIYKYKMIDQKPILPNEDI